jgi:hypothetical protein
VGTITIELPDEIATLLPFYPADKIREARVAAQEAFVEVLMGEDAIAAFNARNFLVPVRPEDLPPEDVKAIQEAFAQIEAGEGIDGETVLAELRAITARSTPTNRSE